MGLSIYSTTGIAIDLGTEEDEKSAYRVFHEQEEDEEWYEGKYPDLPPDWEIDYYGHCNYPGAVLAYKPSTCSGEYYQPSNVDIKGNVTVDSVKAIREFCIGLGMKEVKLRRLMWTYYSH